MARLGPANGCARHTTHLHTAHLQRAHAGVPPGPCLPDRDAGVVAQPFTGSGVFKGYNNVQGLLDVFERHDDPVAALEEWGSDQIRLGDGLLALGDQMEQAFIWDSRDLAQADAASTEAWWHTAVQFPDEFTFEARS